MSRSESFPNRRPLVERNDRGVAGRFSRSLLVGLGSGKDPQTAEDDDCTAVVDVSAGFGVGLGSDAASGVAVGTGEGVTMR